MRVVLFRLMVMLWGVASAALPGVLAITHARDAAAAMAPIQGHVESETAESCPLLHGADCALCSSHRWGSGAPAPAVPVVDAAANLGRRPPGLCLTLSSADLGRSFQPRGPPAA